MEQPRSRIVLLKGHGEVAVCWQGSDVATRRVDEVQGGGGDIEHASVLTDDPEIVTVKMDWVGEANAAGILDDVDGPFVGWGGLLCYCQLLVLRGERRIDGRLTSIATTL